MRLMLALLTLFLIQTGPVIDTDTAADVDLVDVLAHNDEIWSVAVSAAGQIAAGGGGRSDGDYAIYLWDSASGDHQTLDGHTGQVRALAYNADGSLLVSGAFDGQVRLWDVTTGDTLWQVDGDPVWSLAISADDAQIAVGRGTAAIGSAAVHIYDAASGGELLVVDVGETPWPPFVTLFSPDGTQVLTGGLDADLLAWDVSTGEPAGAYVLLEGSNYPVAAADYSPDGSTLAAAVGFVAPFGNLVNLIDPEVAAVREPRLTGHEQLVLAVAYNPAGDVLASGSNDGTVRLWDVTASTELARLNHPDSVVALAFHPDGSLLVSAGADNFLRLWGP